MSWSYGRRRPVRLSPSALHRRVPSTFESVASDEFCGTQRRVEAQELDASGTHESGNQAGIPVGAL
jgi:hypothetical protein